MSLLVFSALRNFNILDLFFAKVKNHFLLFYVYFLIVSLSITYIVYCSLYFLLYEVAIHLLCL